MPADFSMAVSGYSRMASGVTHTGLRGLSADARHPRPAEMRTHPKTRARGAGCRVRRTAPLLVVLAFVGSLLTTTSPRVAWGSRIKSAGQPLFVYTGDTCYRLAVFHEHHDNDCSQDYYEATSVKISGLPRRRPPLYPSRQGGIRPAFQLSRPSRPAPQPVAGRPSGRLAHDSVVAPTFLPRLDTEVISEPDLPG